MSDSQFVKDATVPLMGKDVKQHALPSTVPGAPTDQLRTTAHSALVIVSVMLTVAGATLAICSIAPVTQEFGGEIIDELMADGHVDIYRSQELDDKIMSKLSQGPSCTLGDGLSWIITTTPADCGQCVTLCRASPDCSHLALVVDGRLILGLSSRQEVMDFDGCGSEIHNAHPLDYLLNT